MQAGRELGLGRKPFTHMQEPCLSAGITAFPCSPPPNTRPPHALSPLPHPLQAQQDALVADQAEREAELLRKQVEAQDRKNRAAGSGGSLSTSDDSSEGSSSQDDSSSDSLGCTKPDYSGMSRKEKRAAKKAYEKCRKAVQSDDNSDDSSGDSGVVTTKSLKRSSSGKGVRATFHFCQSFFSLLVCFLD